MQKVHCDRCEALVVDTHRTWMEDTRVGGGTWHVRISRNGGDHADLCVPCYLDLLQIHRDQEIGNEVLR